MGGIVVDGRLLTGDNSAGGEFWLLRNKLRNDCFAEEGASIRAVQSAYADAAGIAVDDLSPKDICDIAEGSKTGDRQAASGSRPTTKPSGSSPPLSTTR